MADLEEQQKTIALKEKRASIELTLDLETLENLLLRIRLTAELVENRPYTKITHSRDKTFQIRDNNLGGEIVDKTFHNNMCT